MNKADRDLRTAKVIELRISGMSYKDIAEAVGFKYTQEVYKILAMNGMIDHQGASKKKVTPSLEVELCKDRVDNKLTYMQLCVKYNISTAVVNKILRKNGLTN